MEQRYTESEVRRMLGIERRQLAYWTRLRLVAPRARWGTRFYSFSDLVSLETIRRLSAQRVPMRKLHRAIAALENELGRARSPLASLHIFANGSEVVVRSSVADSRPIEPLTGQFVLDFENIVAREQSSSDGLALGGRVVRRGSEGTGIQLLPFLRSTAQWRLSLFPSTSTAS